MNNNKKYRVVKLNLNISYYNGGRYSFNFLILKEEYNFMIAVISKIIPFDDLESFEINKSKMEMSVTEEYIANVVTIFNVIRSKIKTNHKQLKLEKGDK